jgi:hypothetical protein
VDRRAGQPDVGILYLDHPTDVRNVYVPLTRGRSSNLDFVATTGEDTAADVLSCCLTTDWIDQPAHTRRAELTGTTISPPSELTGEQLRDLFAERYDLRGTDAAADRARLKQIDQAIWSDNHLRAHRLRLERPDWVTRANSARWSKTPTCADAGARLRPTPSTITSPTAT